MSSGAMAISQHPIKKQGFIKRWISKLVQEELNTPVGVDKSPSISGSIDNSKGIRFTVYPASGGKIIEVYRFEDRNKLTSSNNTNLYIITSDQEFGREIDKIMTMECLR